MRLKDIQDGAEFATGAIDALNFTGAVKNRQKKEEHPNSGKFLYQAEVFDEGGQVKCLRQVITVY